MGHYLTNLRAYLANLRDIQVKNLVNRKNAAQTISSDVTANITIIQSPFFTA